MQYSLLIWIRWYFPDSKVHGANMGPTWVLSAPDGPHVGPLNLAIRVVYVTSCRWPPQVGESHVDLVNCSEITTCESTGVIKKTPFNCSAMDNAICNEDDGIACECAPGYKPFRVKPKILLPCISKGYTMMTSSKTFSALLAFCSWNSPVTLTKASDAELWCFLWSAPEQTVE